MRQVLLLGTLDGGHLLGDARCAAVRAALPDVHLIIGGRDEVPAELPPSCEVVATAVGTVEAAVRDADAVVVCGDPFRRPLLPFLAHLAAHRRGTPVALVGVGAIERHGRGATRLAARLARAADLLVLRDGCATAGLAAAGVAAPLRVGADPAWSALVRNRDRVAAANDRVTIAMHGLPPGREPVAGLAAAIDTLPGDVAVRVLASHHALTPANDLVSALRRRAVIEAIDADLAAVAASLAGDRLAVTGSIAVAMASAAAGTAVLSITGEPEHIALAKRLDQVAVYPDAARAVLQHACGLAISSGGSPGASVEQETTSAGRILDQLRALVDPARFGRPAAVGALSGTAASEGARRTLSP